MRFLPTLLLVLIFTSTTPAEKSIPKENKPLFSLVSPKRTKIRFNNEVRDTRDHNIMIYSNYYGGAGVGVGDINNDGLVDLYFAGNLVGDKLYLNKGDLEFEDITDKAGIIDNGGWSSGVLFADVNQDGFEDIYVTRELYDDEPELRKNKLYINKGDNTFREQAEAYGVADDQRTRHATFLDYDRDGDLDLFLLNQPPNPGDYSKFYKTELLIDEYRPRLLQYTPDKKFVDVTEQAGLSKTGFPNSVTASDLNGDGWTDLFVANDFWAGDWYYINNGDGTFTDKIHDYLRHTSFSSMGVDAADINNDGKLDMMVVDMVAEDNYRLKANMSGMNPKAFWKVVDEGGHYQYMFNMLHFNIGDGYFSDIAQLANVASTDWSWSVLMADLDNDGWKDIHITNGLMRDIRNNDAAKNFAKYIESALHQYIQENPNPQNVTIWDVVDIEKALKITPSQKLHNYVFKNNGDLTFSKKIEEWGMDQETFSSGSAYADLDNDGDLDLVINNVNDIASVYENHASERSNGNYLRIKPIVKDKTVSLFGTKVWIETTIGKQFYEFTNVRGMYSTSETIAHFGLGALDQVKKVRIRWPDGREQILRNVSANQVIEVNYKRTKKTTPTTAAASPKPLLNKVTQQLKMNFVHRENEFDDYRMQVLLPHKMSTLGPCLVVGDVNGDELEDFFVGGSASFPATLFIQTNEGNFEEYPNEIFVVDKIHEDLGAAFGDFDNDGDNDLYVVSGGNEFNPKSDSYRDRLYLNDGLGNFSSGNHLLPPIHSSGSKVRPEDFDKDGDLDLFVAGRHIPWAYPEPAGSVLLRNDEGRFTDVTKELAPELLEIGMVNDAAWFDYDGDGAKDLVLVGEWMPVTVLQNQGQQFRVLPGKELGLEGTEGWWFSVETADMDLDGDEDIIAGNLGLNYKYKASLQEPFEVYYEDFDDNGSKDIVLTYYNFGTKYPLRGRQCSSEQVPMLEEKFKTYDLFASADVTQIYGKQNLEKSLYYKATSFGTTYFANLGNGQFQAMPLPNEAQLSSVNDFIVEDFNDDRNPDILLAGNLYNAEVETARNDAGFGLLLAGDGKGQFTPVNREESGFFVPHNVKNLATLKGKESQLIIVACNDDPLQIFQYRKRQSK